MSDNIDYAAINIPSDEDPTEYHYSARRAEILDKVREAGHPGALNQAALGRRYGVSRVQIHKDMDVLSEYLDKHRSSRRGLDLDALHRRAIAGLLDAAQGPDADPKLFKKAWSVGLEYDDWIQSRQSEEELRERLDSIEGRLDARDVGVGRDRSADRAWIEKHGTVGGDQ